MSKAKLPDTNYTYYYRVTADNTKGTSVSVSSLAGFNDGDYVTLKLPKQKVRLTQRCAYWLKRLFGGISRTLRRN